MNLKFKLKYYINFEMFIFYFRIFKIGPICCLKTFQNGEDSIIFKLTYFRNFRISDILPNILYDHRRNSDFLNIKIVESNKNRKSLEFLNLPPYVSFVIFSKKSHYHIPLRNLPTHATSYL
jgi:hypothetical protein